MWPVSVPDFEEPLFSVSVTWALLTNYPQLVEWGATAFSPTTLTGGKTYAGWYEIDTGGAHFGYFSITTSPDPGQSWLISASILGVTRTGASAISYSYSGSTATWQWSGAWGFPSGANPATGTVVHQW